MTSARKRMFKSYQLQKHNLVFTVKHSIRRIAMSHWFLKTLDIICSSLSEVRVYRSFEILKEHQAQQQQNLTVWEQNKTYSYRIHILFLVLNICSYTNIPWCYRIKSGTQWWVNIINNRTPGSGYHCQYIEAEANGGTFIDDHSRCHFVNENWLVSLSFLIVNDIYIVNELYIYI